MLASPSNVLCILKSIASDIVTDSEKGPAEFINRFAQSPIRQSILKTWRANKRHTHTRTRGP